jgi:hypothetical protein
VLSSSLQVVLGLLAVLAAIGAVVAIAFNHIVAGSDSSDYSWSDPINERHDVVILGTYLGIAGFALLMVWAFKAHQTTDGLDPARRTWRPGWVISSWFIPVFNLVGPQLVLSEIDRIARSDRTPRGVVPDWRRTRVNPIGWAWWVFLVAGCGLQILGSHVEAAATSVGDERFAYVLYSAGFVCWAASGLCGLFYVRGVAGRLATIDMSARSTHRTPPIPDASRPPPAGPVSVYDTLDWTAREVHQVHEALTERGIEHRFEHGKLRVDVADGPFVNRVIGEIVAAHDLNG